MEQSESINELAAALCHVQHVIEGARKDSANPFFKSKYADLESVWGVCREPLAQNGLAVIQTTEPSPDGVTVVTTLAHTSGQWVRGKLCMRPVKDDPQGIGSCITYARRYALAAIVGVVQVDDDAEHASGRGAAGNGAALTPPKRRDSPPTPAQHPGHPVTSEQIRSTTMVEPRGDQAALAVNGDDQLTLDGELSLEERWGRLIGRAEMRSLMGLVSQHGVSTDELKAYCLEKFGVGSRKELRICMMPDLGQWVGAHRKGVN